MQFIMCLDQNFKSGTKMWINFIQYTKEHIKVHMFSFGLIWTQERILIAQLTHGKEEIAPLCALLLGWTSFIEPFCLLVMDVASNCWSVHRNIILCPNTSNTDF